jgi:folate-binding protein YgfZ
MSRPELTDAGVLTVRGADSKSFLQGQLTNDLDLLTETRLLPAAVANAQGRVLSVLRLLALPDGVLIWVPRNEVASLRSHLARYTLRAKVELRDESDQWRALWPAPDTDHSTLARLLGGLPAQSGAVARHRGLIIVALDVQHRIAVLGHTEDILPIAALASSPIANVGHVLEEIRAGWPEIHAETRGLFVPQMLNLDLLAAVSFRKGCYTGQEIIARTQHLGRIKRRMLRARGMLAPPAPGTPVLARGEVTGHVVCAARDEHGGCEMLATISVADRTESLTVDSTALERLNLPYPIPELDDTTPGV